ncbi:hypothetical protein BCR41DRAFT_344322 [Lobosporangium transversale]|uniref:Uncharacterized protein n=1 Tax=Lobosporangium transversale TaxID=64571 RepID=A0A1Y2H4M4_9FUNG|nr:hypothetical protein BCR41DRAFT_344322 [Lobosporangium transversale]ORZ28941.1 hypothetical protein BCR41DRAFT_344322 [Lobosporangium transversale]|eukprot:XP_021886614.1 hypothetical protein BCR41DRAFT_344322 [Lobosporangium transversale]
MLIRKKRGTDRRMDGWMDAYFDGCGGISCILVSCHLMPFMSNERSVHPPIPVFFCTWT